MLKDIWGITEPLISTSVIFLSLYALICFVRWEIFNPVPSQDYMLLIRVLVISAVIILALGFCWHYRDRSDDQC